MTFKKVYEQKVSYLTSLSARIHKTVAGLITVALIGFSSSTLAGTICSNSVITEQGSKEISSELLFELKELISSENFDARQPFEFKIERKRCIETGKGEKSLSDSIYSLDDVPPPDPVPQDGDKRTLTQTRSAGTYSWTYTYMDNSWVLTSFSFTPARQEIVAPEI